MSDEQTEQNATPPDDPADEPEGGDGLRSEIREALRDYRCRGVEYHEGGGMQLVDALNPTFGKGDIGAAKEELDSLADHIATRLSDRPVQADEPEGGVCGECGHSWDRHYLRCYAGKRNYWCRRVGCACIRSDRPAPEDAHEEGERVECRMCGREDAEIVYSERRDEHRVLCSECLLLGPADHVDGLRPDAPEDREDGDE